MSRYITFLAISILALSSVGCGSRSQRNYETQVTVQAPKPADLRPLGEAAKVFCFALIGIAVITAVTVLAKNHQNQASRPEQNRPRKYRGRRSSRHRHHHRTHNSRSHYHRDRRHGRGQRRRRSKGRSSKARKASRRHYARRKMQQTNPNKK